MGLALVGPNLQVGKTQLPLPLGMLAQPLVGGVALGLGGVGQARRKIVAEMPVPVGVLPRQQILEEAQVGVQALLKTPGEQAPARIRGLAALMLGVLSRDGEVQTHRPMDGTCDHGGYDVRESISRW